MARFGPGVGVELGAGQGLGALLLQPAALVFGLCLLLAAAGLAGWWWRRRRRLSPHERLAWRADRNGRALLQLADEIEGFLIRQHEAGISIRQQRHWPQLCRQVAAEHLECINCLLLEGVWHEEGKPPGDR
ncbi:hypothetical protein [Lysobacter sp. ESA13C]|uniref:hypothetical protein n=1 Tax=Lysobacter sp. ESA13C TaxID=2862676 RepID=UPI001CBD7B49|nr:hypothetical protein [Lysobacter sp. ESA13C]